MKHLLQHHAHHLLEQANKHAKQLNAKNPETLHDFRVSVRRLRSFLKTYKDMLDKSGKKSREQLGKLMDLTNAGRDNDVHIAWLNEQQKNASKELKTGINLVLESFADHPELDIKSLQKQFNKHNHKLSHLIKRVKSRESFHLLTTHYLAEYSRTLKSELSQLAKDKTILHQTRITGKRLRYTLELLDIKESQALVKQLKNLQDTLGQINDLELLKEKLEASLYAEVAEWSHHFLNASKNPDANEKLVSLDRIYGLAALQKHTLATLQKHYSTLKDQWLGKASGAFFKELNTFTKTLAKTPDQTQADN